MLKKFFWESVSSFLFTVLGLCMMAVSVQPRLFAKCAGHSMCNETSVFKTCVYNAQTKTCTSGGCSNNTIPEMCGTCVCVLHTRNECYCEEPEK